MMERATALEMIELQLKRKLFNEIRERVAKWERDGSGYDVIMNNLGVFLNTAEIDNSCLSLLRVEEDTHEVH